MVPSVALIGGGIGLTMMVVGFFWNFMFPQRPALPDSAPPALTQVDAPPQPVPTPPTEQPAAQPAAQPVEARPTGIVGLLRSALGRSRAALQGRFDELFGRPVDESLFEDLQDTLLVADVGVQTAESLTEHLRERARKDDADPDTLRASLQTAMVALLEKVDAPFASGDQPLTVILVVGVNGSGKTTTIGKLASRYASQGKKVMMAAGDTYRAAAAQQLEEWAKRTDARFVRGDEGGDPGAVVYQALEQALAADVDVCIIDTAGRLQTAKPLMEQLSKLRRVIQKHVPDGPHETLLVLDGTMGQNGLSQAQLFNEATPLSGVVVTKLDGTAKGGMILTIANELELPVKFIGIGEGVDDLRPFEPAPFVEALTA